MTEPYNGNLFIKIARSESVSESDRRVEIEAFAARIASEGIALPSTAYPDGLEVDARHRATVERVIGNGRINREDLGEAHLELGPAESNYPPKGSTPSSS